MTHSFSWDRMDWRISSARKVRALRCSNVTAGCDKPPGEVPARPRPAQAAGAEVANEGCEGGGTTDSACAMAAIDSPASAATRPLASARSAKRGEQA